MVAIDSGMMTFSPHGWASPQQRRPRYWGLLLAFLIHIPLYFIVTSEADLIPQAQNLVDITIFPTPKPKIIPPQPRPEPKLEPNPEIRLQRPEIRIKEEVKPTEKPAPLGHGITPVPPAAEVYDPIPAKKGVRLDGNGIRSRMGGRQFHLEMGRLDQQGSNRLINTVIELHADGTSAVKLTHYFYQTYHSDYSSTRSESGTGNWWIEGDRWCHRSPIINYGTKDCYDITVDGPVVRLYYARCDGESSTLCKAGRIAAEGEVK